MRDRETRHERNFDTIERFLKSRFEGLELRLYPREIEVLEKDFPEVIIEKGDAYKKTGLFKCHVKRRV